MSTRQPMLRVGLTIIVLVLCGGHAEAARLLKASVLVDGKVRLQAHYQDDGRPGAATVWTYLREPTQVADDLPPLEPLPNDPLRARLEGDVVVRIEHGGFVIAEAAVTELTLIRKDAKDQRWFLPPEEESRTALAAGLPAPPIDEGFELSAGLPLAILGILVVLAIVAWLVLARRPGATAGPDEREST